MDKMKGCVKSVEEKNGFVKSVLIVVVFSLFSANMSELYAQPQIELKNLVVEYSQVEGAKTITASGVKMAVMRKALKMTPVAPIASQVESVEILKMKNASAQERSKFESVLNRVLAQYTDCGQHSSPNGPVEVYVLMKDAETAQELVIYNREIFSLNILYGDFSVESLQGLQ